MKPKYLQHRKLFENIRKRLSKLKTKLGLHFFLVGTYRNTYVPFGLQNAPDTIRSTLDIIIYDLRWKQCLLYIDEFVISFKNNRRHGKVIDKVLKLLHWAGMYLELCM